MIYVGSKIYINEYSNRDFVANYRIEGFHANKIVTEDIAGEIRKNKLNVTKVYALGEREMLGVTPAEMAAIGDSDNDAEMLRAVGMPVAMGNADPALKALAKYVTADCDHDGVAQAVYHLFQ